MRSGSNCNYRPPAQNTEQISSQVSFKCQNPTPKSSRTDDQQLTTHKNDDENDENSDSGSMTFPLFMDGLPKNFTTNPHLAAIASLLNDEEDVNGNVDDDDKSKEENDGNNTNDKTGNILMNDRSLGRASKDRTKTNSLRTKRRQQQRSSPYPRQHYRKCQNQTSSKTASVGEITLFMNMWKP